MTGTSECLSVDLADRVAWVTINHPPINLFDTPLIRALAELARDLGEDPHVGALVIQSGDPDFFIAHGDVNSILGSAGGRSDSSPFQHMLEQFRQMPKPTIGKIDGIARGGGLELLAALDMRFCSLENTRLGQPEVPLGIIPGGGGTSRWPRHIGYARAVELVLSGADIDGATAEKWGMVNRAMPAADLDAFVDGLARRIASFPPHAVALAKRVSQHEGPLADALAFEADSYARSAADPAAIRVMRRFMEQGGQTREVETGPDPFGGLGNGSA
ncbi:MAG: enoyl-CoA hydratase/isomerase family protein [Novosphingobium sp.]|nr:enoyl-CoA hydratase/isomerase family protein [Novosphingobium sp.]